MTETQTIGVDIAKHVFQLRGAGADGHVTFRKTPSRGQLLVFLRKHRTCTAVMEACATAHRWGREISALGREVRLIAPVYVKSFVKRQSEADPENDPGDLFPAERRE